MFEQTVFVNTKIPWFDIVAVGFMQAPGPYVVQDYSSAVSKYVVKNRGNLGVHINGLIIIAAVVSPGFSDDARLWVSETPPSYTIWWDRIEFPVLIDSTAHQIFYYQKPRGRPEALCRRARAHSDKWFSFQ